MDNIREKLVGLLTGCGICFHCLPSGIHEEQEKRRIADHLLANGVTMQEWIPVSERLPDIYDKDPNWSQTVLFRTAEGHIHSGYRNIGRPQASFYDDDWTPPYWLDESERLSFEEDEVTHWMPLPQPPKGE